MQVCNENHSAVVVFDNNSCPLCAMLDAFGKPQDAVELGTTQNTGSPKLLTTLDEILGNINKGRWSVAEALLRDLRQQLRAGA